MRIHHLDNFIRADSEKIAGFDQGRTAQVEQPASLLDYCCISGQSEMVMPSLSYTMRGDYCDVNSNVARQLNFCEKAQVGYAYEESKLGKEDVWITKDEKGRATNYLEYNKDKVNYLIHYYMEQGGDMSTYPFEHDTEETKQAYKSLVMWYGGRVIEESRLKNVFDTAGINEGTFVIDAKGDISIETDEEVSPEKRESMKKQLMEAGKTADALRNMIFGESPKFVGLPSEKKIEISSMYYVGWILYRYYSVRIEDLSMAEDGSISGLPDEVYEKHDYQSQPDFYDNIRNLIRRGGKARMRLAGLFIAMRNCLFYDSNEAIRRHQPGAKYLLTQLCTL